MTQTELEANALLQNTAMVLFEVKAPRVSIDLMTSATSRNRCYRVNELTLALRVFITKTSHHQAISSLDKSSHETLRLQIFVTNIHLRAGPLCGRPPTPATMSC
jgi:hypothetical protein